MSWTEAVAIPSIHPELGREFVYAGERCWP
jgi:hypothetical protein